MASKQRPKGRNVTEQRDTSLGKGPDGDALSGGPAREKAAGVGFALLESCRTCEPIRVLLAEDNPPNRFVAKTFLAKRGFHVLCAEDGAEALDILDTEEVDIVLMDIQMPVMDGVEVIRTIRGGRSGADPSVPIIALTAYAMKGDRERFLKIGADEYASKPVDFKALFMTIEHLVKVRREAREASDNSF
jgi:CheY-like chemotaxis protein